MNDTSHASDTAVPPIVCTLNATQLTAQVLEWADLRELALSSEQIEGGVASTYPLDLADSVADLAARETGCCGSWLNISTREVDGVFRLELTTLNPDGLATIMSMAGLSS